MLFSSNRNAQAQIANLVTHSRILYQTLDVKTMLAPNKNSRVQLTTHTFQLITAVPTVIAVVTFPLLQDAAAIEAGEVGTDTPHAIVHNAVLVVVGQIPVALLWTLALHTTWP